MNCLCPLPSRRQALAMLSATTVLGKGVFAAGRRPAHHRHRPSHRSAQICRRQTSISLSAEKTRGTSACGPGLHVAGIPKFALDQMEKADVATALVSMTSPGVWFDDGNDPARLPQRVSATSSVPR